MPGILILSSKFPYPLKDGGAIATYQLFDGLKKGGNDVHLLSFNTKKHFIDSEKVPVSYFSKDDFTLVNLNTRIKPTRLLLNLFFSRRPYILQRFKSSCFSKELIELLKRKHFDIVQIEGLYMLQYLCDIRAYSNVKVAFRAHNLEHQIWVQLAKCSSSKLKGWYSKLLSKRILAYEKQMLNTYDLLLPISEEDAGLYSKSGNHVPLKVVPTGFDFNVPAQQNNQDIHKLFFIGSLEWQPNQEGLIWFLSNCWPGLRKQLPKIQFHIAGRGTPNWLVKKFELEGVVWEGEVEDASTFMQDKTIMVVPLQSGSGMRIKIIEAFVNSKAVVATSIATRGTGAIDEKHLFITDVPEGFVQKILVLIQSKEQYLQLINNAYNYALDNFNNKKIALSLHQFYEENLA